MKESSLKKKKLLYEGKAKKMYHTDNEDLVIQEFKNDATAFDGTKKGTIKDKGIINNQLSAYLFNLLDSYHVPTHFVKSYSDNAMVVRRLDMIPVEVVMRNIATGSYVKRNKIKDGTKLEQPVLEFFLKDDEKHDPLISEKEILENEYTTAEELTLIERFARKINAVLKDFFLRRNMLLVDFKLEFGRNKLGKIFLADEISPDTCRFWDATTNEKLDKDRFRHDLGNVEEAYREVFNRVFRLQGATQT
ncbi:MAG: phosphoribosylaminoimidazolesuccinocarboxamide synthase [bacterium]